MCHTYILQKSEQKFYSLIQWWKRSRFGNWAAVEIISAVIAGSDRDFSLLLKVQIPGRQTASY
jgi:hypothetical protein